MKTFDDDDYCWLALEYPFHQRNGFYVDENDRILYWPSDADVCYVLGREEIKKIKDATKQLKSDRDKQSNATLFKDIINEDKESFLTKSQSGSLHYLSIASITNIGWAVFFGPFLLYGLIFSPVFFIEKFLNIYISTIMLLLNYALLFSSSLFMFHKKYGELQLRKIVLSVVLGCQRENRPHPIVHYIKVSSGVFKPALQVTICMFFLVGLVVFLEPHGFIGDWISLLFWVIMAAYVLISCRNFDRRSLDVSKIRIRDIGVLK